LRSLEPEEFLARCHADIREIYAYWDRKRAGRPLPRRKDIDPAEIAPLLPGVMLIDVVDDARRYVYRLVGTREVEARGKDPTGKAIGEQYFGTSPERVLENYDLVRSRRAPLLDDYQFRAPGDRYADEEAIFLPLSADGETVTQILVYTRHRRIR
jgi:hypothetical protein